MALIANDKITLAKTVRRIAKRSTGVAWEVASEGLTLARTRHGYALTTMPRFYADIMPERVTILGDDGVPMAHGHVLTTKERERATWAILCGAPSAENRQNSTGKPPTRR